jgi:hypothetical protein
MLRAVGRVAVGISLVSRTDVIFLHTGGAALFAYQSALDVRSG